MILSYRKYSELSSDSLNQNEEDLRENKEINHQERILNREYNYISKGINNMEINPPMEKSREILGNSILRIKNYQQSIGKSEALKQAKDYDNGMVQRFKGLTESMGFDFPEKKIKGVKKEIGDFVLVKKYEYDFPRPYEVAKNLRIPLDYLETSTSNSPSYPSGHSAQAWMISEVLSSLYPKGRPYYENLARSISLSRVLGGLHFFEDCEEGKNLAKKAVQEGFVKFL